MTERGDLGAGDLRHALERGEIGVAYQPLIDMRSGRVRRFEALCRWTHPSHGRIAPSYFIPLAEATDQIGGLTLEVARQTLVQLPVWREALPDLRVSLNVSIVTLLDRTFATRLAAVARAAGPEPSVFGVEVTESTFVRKPAAVAEALRALRDIGIRVDIDDFGTGYSSLARLVELPIDALKIDRRFVSPMARDHRSESIVRACIGLAHDLGLETVAEGIEDRETWELLRAHGCDTAQGYHLAPPMPAHEVTQWLESWRAGLSFMERSRIGDDLVGHAGREAATPDVLVVDDEPAILELIRTVLEDDGFKVVTAANGAEALRAIEAAHPAVVLLDMQMPVVDGAAFVRAVRKRRLDVPIVVMTAGASAKRWAGELNVAGYISKPFEVTRLLEVASQYAVRN